MIEVLEVIINDRYTGIHVALVFSLEYTCNKEI